MTNFHKETRRITSDKAIKWILKSAKYANQIAALALQKDNIIGTHPEQAGVKNIGIIEKKP